MVPITAPAMTPTDGPPGLLPLSLASGGELVLGLALELGIVVLFDADVVGAAEAEVLELADALGGV